MKLAIVAAALWAALIVGCDRKPSEDATQSTGGEVPTVSAKPIDILPPPVSDKPFESGDKILSINGEPVKDFRDVQIAIAMAEEGQNVELIVERKSGHIERIILEGK